MLVAEESQWSLLPVDILNTIAALLNYSADVDTCTLSIPIHNLRLRSVCKQWRSSISPPKPNIIVPFPIAPTAARNPSQPGYFNLSLITTYLLHQSSSNCKYWLLRVENGSIRNIWHPLNPLSRLPTGFPRSINLLNVHVSPIATSYLLHFFDPSKTYVDVEFNERILFSPKKVALSTSGPLVAIAIYGLKLYSLKVGDEKWKAVDDSYYVDVVFRKGKFYAVNIKGGIVWLGGSDLKAFEIVPRLPPYVHGGNSKNLEESNGELFLIDKYLGPGPEMYYNEEIDDYVTKRGSDNVRLKIYRLDEDLGEWEGVNDLGDYVFFIGDDCSYSIFARDFPGLIPNCVYFCDDSFCDVNKGLENAGGYEGFGEFVGDTGTYCLRNKRCGPLAIFPDHWSPFWPPPCGHKSKALKSKNLSDVNEGLDNAGRFKGIGEFVGDTGVYCLDSGRCGPLAISPDRWSPFWPPIWHNPKALKFKK